MYIWFRHLALLLFLLCFISPLSALDFEVIDTANEDGTPLSIGSIKVLSVFRLFTTSKNDQDLVELSALAWSKDENILYALSDHGSIFHFRPAFNENGLSDIHLIDAYPLLGASDEDLSYPWSDSEGLYLKNGDNGRKGDDELLVSFELKPRLQWHQPDGTFIKKESLPEWLEDKSNYHNRHKALESVTIHHEYGVITAPELPMEDADWQILTLYQANGGELTTSRDELEDMSLCAIEALPGGDLLILERRHSLLAPTWTTALTKLSAVNGNTLEREVMATMNVGGRMPVDNYEGLTRHTGHRYFMVSDNNEHFMQQTLLVYFELLP